MPDPSDPPAPDAPPAVVSRRRCNWGRIRVYLLALVLIATIWGVVGVTVVRFHPERVVARALQQLPFPSSAGNVAWVNRRTLRIDNVKLGDFFYADSVIVTASPWGLWHHHLAKVQVTGGQLFTKNLFAAMDKMGKGSGQGLNWVIARLEISRGLIRLDNLIANTSIPIGLGVRHPIVVNGLRLGAPDSSPGMKEERVVEIGPVNITSPVDPLVTVLAFPLTRVRFTWEELWHHHVREIDLVRPTLFLGEDLFWFSSQFKKQEQETTPGSKTAQPWEVAQFEVQYGRLAVNAFGQPVVHFPFFFGTRVDNVRLDQLDQISARSVVAIHRLDQDYPDYKIRLVGLQGRLYFSWPPTDAKANNVVNVISVEEVSWDGIPVKNVNTTVTFDPNGVYGKLTNGTCEGGQLNGNFEFYYSKGFTWNANFFATRVNSQPIAQKLVGNYFDLTGLLYGNLSVQGRVTEILKCQGQLALPNPGRLELKSLGELLGRLPANTSALKRDAAKLAIDSFRTYPYRSGKVEINYVPSGGVGSLKLDGPVGQRLFQVYWHPWTSLTEK